MGFKGLGNNVEKMCKAHQPPIAQPLLLICAFNRQKKNPLENKIFCQLSYTPGSHLTPEYCDTCTVNWCSQCAHILLFL